jgi:two-component system sensor histidine kinase AlgZ
VYHGVEPGTGTSDVLVRITKRGERVLAQIENPYLEAEVKRAGNRMALENIRERLQLFLRRRSAHRHQGGRRALSSRAGNPL